MTINQDKVIWLMTIQLFKTKHKAISFYNTLYKIVRKNISVISYCFVSFSFPCFHPRRSGRLPKKSSKPLQNELNGIILLHFLLLSNNNNVYINMPNNKRYEKWKWHSDVLFCFEEKIISNNSYIFEWNFMEFAMKSIVVEHLLDTLHNF